METTSLMVEVRTDRGKGPARRMRKAGKIPAVFYGHGVEPTAISFEPKVFSKALLGERRRNSVFEFEIGGTKHFAMVKDLEVDPASRELLHVDFFKVLSDRPITIEIPFSTTGRAIGVQMGGLLNTTRRSVTVNTTPANIPTSIVHDVSDLNMNETVSVADLTMPEGCTAALDPKLTLALITEDKRAAKDAEATTEAAETAAE